MEIVQCLKETGTANIKIFPYFLNRIPIDIKLCIPQATVLYPFTCRHQIERTRKNVVILS
jgi:hypothetical protein